MATVFNDAAMMPLIPAWSIAPWVFVLLMVVALHVWHARAGRGLARWWHLSHVAMAAGMVVMFVIAPHEAPTLYWVLAAAFGAGAAALVTGVPRLDGVDRLIWVAVIADQLIMAYMLLPLTNRPAVVTYLAIAYLVMAAVAWALAPAGYERMTRPRSPAVPVPPAAVLSDPVPPDTVPPDTVPPAGATTTPVPLPARQPGVARVTATLLTQHLTTGVRVTLAVMAVTMAWMLLAMQLMDGSMIQHHMPMM